MRCGCLPVSPRSPAPSRSRSCCPRSGARGAEPDHPGRARPDAARTGNRRRTPIGCDRHRRRDPRNLIAIAVSPIFPIGIARRAEVSPGVEVDGALLFLGAAASSGSSSSSAGSRRTAPRAPRRRNRHRARHPRRTAADARRPRRSPAIGHERIPHGARAGSGRQRIAGPIRAARRRVGLARCERRARVRLESRSPRDDATSLRLVLELQGARQYVLEPLRRATTSDSLRSVASPTSRPRVTHRCRSTVGRRAGWGFTPIRGTIDPTIVRGRAARGPREVALGAATLRAIDKKIGDTVQVRESGRTVEYRVVGQVVLPQLSGGDIQPLADGAAFTGAGFTSLHPTEQRRDALPVGKLRPGRRPGRSRATNRHDQAVPRRPQRAGVHLGHGRRGTGAPTRGRTRRVISGGSRRSSHSSSQCWRSSRSRMHS